MHQSKVIAHCGMMTALSVVLMILGHVLGLGLYISPLLAGLCLMPIGQKFGPKYQWLVWGAASLLSFILVSEMEQNLMYLTIFGLYPILQPMLEKLPRLLVLPCKLLYFNVVFISVEALIVFLIAPEIMQAWMFLLLIALSNVVFLLYDRILPHAHLLLYRYFGKFKH